jgi:acyl dehydratase
MEIAALDYAFNELELQKLSCEVISSNHKVIRFHRKFGFEVEGVFRSHHWMDNAYFDVYRLAITRKNWIEKMRPVICEGPIKRKYRVGQTFSQEFSISKGAVTAFARLSGDQNPIHINKQAAIEAGFEREIAHGAYLGGLISKVLGIDFPGQGTIFLSQKLRFLKPAYVDTIVRIEIVVLSLIGRRMIVGVKAKNEDGDILSEGEVQVLVPK